MAKISTEAGRVVDIFYVRERESGAKVSDEARQQEVRRRLIAAVDALDV